jgi:hypothetical protein
LGRLEPLEPLVHQAPLEQPVVLDQPGPLGPPEQQVRLVLKDLLEPQVLRAVREQRGQQVPLVRLEVLDLLEPLVLQVPKVLAVLGEYLIYLV